MMKQNQPERHVLTDEQIDALVRAVCHSDPIMVTGEYCLTVDEVRALLSSASSQDAIRNAALVDAECDDCGGCGVHGEFTSYEYNEWICELCGGTGKVQVYALQSAPAQNV